MSQRAIIYARVSLDRDGTKASPETQEAECRAFAAGKGWQVVSVYVDRNLSAFKPGVKRPELEATLRAIEAGQADVLLVFKVDRLTRGGIPGLWPILARVQAAGATLASAKEDIDPLTPMGQAMLGFIASQARQESENTRLRVQAANNGRLGRAECTTAAPGPTATPETARSSRRRPRSSGRSPGGSRPASPYVRSPTA